MRARSNGERMAAPPDYARRWAPPMAFVVALAAWYLAPLAALSLTWAVVYAVLVWRWPRWALALMPLTFPFWFAPVHLSARLAFPLSELALAVVTLMVTGKVVVRVGRWRARLVRLARGYATRLGWPVITGAALLLGGMTIGVAIARAPQPALRAWRWEIVEPLVYATMAVWSLRGRWLWRTLWAFIASGVMVAALVVVQATFAHVTVAPLGAGGGLVKYPAWSGLDWRATAIIYGSPNTAGAWMARALPLALAVALWPGARSGRARRWLAVGAVVALVVGLGLTGSRGAWLGAATGVCVVVGGWVWVGRGPHPACGHLQAPVGTPLKVEGTGELTAGGQPPSPLREPATVGSPSPRRRGGRGVRSVASLPAFLIALTVAAALIYGGSALWLAPLLRLAGGAHGGSGAVRLLVWQAAEAMGRDHPLFGVGPDQFLYYYDPSHTNHPYLIPTVNGRPSPAASEPNLSHPHNLGLELWLSAGVAGLVGLMLALAGAAWRGMATLRWEVTQRASWRGAVALGVMGALAVGLAHGLVDSAYFEPDYALAFWWGVAALVALSRASARRPSTPVTSRS
jgi:O-antigen ligase/polysaccharide polymerase Wzy-like membrane protein